jgi:hypothetical protein
MVRIGRGRLPHRAHQPTLRAHDATTRAHWHVCMRPSRAGRHLVAQAAAPGRHAGPDPYRVPPPRNTARPAGGADPPSRICGPCRETRQPAQPRRHGSRHDGHVPPAGQQRLPKPVARPAGVPSVVGVTYRNHHAIGLPHAYPTISCLGVPPSSSRLLMHRRNPGQISSQVGLRRCVSPSCARQPRERRAAACCTLMHRRKPGRIDDRVGLLRCVGGEAVQDSGLVRNPYSSYTLRPPSRCPEGEAGDALRHPEDQRVDRTEESDGRISDPAIGPRRRRRT